MEYAVIALKKDATKLELRHNARFLHAEKLAKSPVSLLLSCYFIKRSMKL